MRASLLILGLAGLTVLGGCAGTGQRSNYMADEDRLAADCRERGGILSPTGGQSGRPETDNVCKITGQPSSRVGG